MLKGQGSKSVQNVLTTAGLAMENSKIFTRVIPIASVVTSTLCIYIDAVKLNNGQMGLVQFSYNTTANVMTAIPLPVTGAIGLTMNIASPYIFKK